MNESLLNILVSVIGGVVSGIVAVAIFLGTYKEKINQLEKKSEKMEEKVNNLHADMATQQAVTAGLQRDIDRASGIAQAHSPLALTEKGWKLVKDSGAFAIYDAIKDELVDELEASNPHSQYDVQEKARWMMGTKTEDERFVSVEDWAFEHGADFGQIMRSLGLPLRDYYFKVHPEIVNPKETY